MSARALEITDLAKAFQGSNGQARPVIELAHFALDCGEQMALHGASGSGKTTLLHLVAGILEADRGRIELAGVPMTGRTESERDRLRAGTIGYVFQTFNLLQGYSALENVMLAMLFGTGVDRSRARGLLERVGLAERLDDPPARLSTGQQQRVAVARALANRPRLVLADEPTGNLDPEQTCAVLDLICEVCAEEEAALLLVSHDSEVLKRFGRVEALSDLNCGARP